MSESTYKAFISYSHEDEAIVQKLHRSLERYRVPRKLRKGDAAPRLGRMFRDREELPSAPRLGDKISQALDRSEYLLVVCSAHSRQSR